MIQFSKDFPEKLRSSILVSEVVGKKVKLKAKGREFGGLCPFHNEKTPSFTVNDQKGFYHCFGCQAHGDVIGFVMNSEGLNFGEAVIKLANDFGIAIPQIKHDFAQENKIAKDHSILEKICQFFEENLFSDEGRKGLSYLQSRGINLNNIKKFRLGFAPNSYDKLNKHLKLQAFSDDELSKTGAIGKSDKGLYDKFRNRVIFPITDKKGQVIAFGGRTISDDLPKYLNSSETELFKKNQTLYNLFFARKAIFSKGFAIVVEGYMDTISLAKSGIENVVAGLGTALSSEHIKEIFYITDKIIICLDGDLAGVKAAMRVSEIALPLINAKKNIFFTILPNKMDPDDFITEFGASELEKLFTQAIPLSEMILQFALQELEIKPQEKVSAEKKAKLETLLNKKLETIQDATSKKHFANFFKDSLFSLGKNNKNFQPQSPLNAKFLQSKSNKFEDLLALEIIALLVKFPELINFSYKNLNLREHHFNNDKLDLLKETIIEIIDSQDTIPQSFATENLDLKEINHIIANIKITDLTLASTKLSILLLKDLLIQVNQQYKSALANIDEIGSQKHNDKISEIFIYKNSLEQEISSLEKELI